MHVNLKKKIHEYCIEYIKERIQTAEKNINEAREAANNETKSSAGDKYETAREMMQQEIDMNLSRLAEAQTQLQLLEQIDPEKVSNVVGAGSLITTNKGIYYVATGIGKILMEGQHFMAISITSPIGIAMKGLKKGDSFSFNGNTYLVEDIG